MSQTRSGYRRSLGGLIGAILACLGLILAIWLLSQLQGDPDVDPAPPIDYAEELAGARAAAPYDVLAPSQLPDGWRATSASFDVAGPIQTWHLGMLTGDDEYVGLEQSNATVSQVVEGATPADQPGPPAMIDGARWQTLTSGEGETALILAGDDVTTVVTGTASRETLVDFVASLDRG